MDAKTTTTTSAARRSDSEADAEREIDSELEEDSDSESSSDDEHFGADPVGRGAPGRGGMGRGAPGRGGMGHGVPGRGGMGRGAPGRGGMGRGSGPGVNVLFGFQFGASSSSDEEQDDEAIAATIRAASEDVIGGLFRKYEDKDELGDLLQERRAGLDIISTTNRIRSHALADELITSWEGLQQPDVLAALRARKLQLAAGTAPADVARIAERVAQLSLPPGNGQDGCEQRADIVCGEIAAQFPDVARANLSKIWTFPKSADKPLHPEHRWKWHVAPCVRLASGEQVVFDRVLLPSGPGRLDEWLGRQNLALGDRLVVERPWEITAAPPHPDQPDPRSRLGLLGLATPL